MIQDGRGGVNQIENRAAPCYDNHTATKAPSFGVPRLRCGVAVGVVPGGLLFVHPVHFRQLARRGSRPDQLPPIVQL